MLQFHIRNNEIMCQTELSKYCLRKEKELPKNCLRKENELPKGTYHMLKWILTKLAVLLSAEVFSGRRLGTTLFQGIAL